jgi:UDP-N-acetylglucosamine transferase subunit ALG13
VILVSLGTHERQFLRLAKEIEKLIAEGKINEEVIVQTGYTKYQIKGARCYDFIEFEKMQEYLSDCRILVTHSGVGSIMSGLEHGKPVVAVPRRQQLNEHSDDHQMQITQKMAEKGAIIPVYDIGQLWEAIKEAGKRKPVSMASQKNPIFGIVENVLAEWSTQSS